MSSLGSYKRAQEARKALLNRGARHWLDADGSEDAAVAQHEASHALVGRLLGLTLTSATVEPDARFGGCTTWASALETIVLLVAGNEGEKLFGGGSDNGCKNDLAQARALARSISDDEIGDTIKRARRAARSILKANFVPLTKLAIALIDRRTLDLAEIEEIIAANAPDDDASDGGDDDAELLAPSIFDRDPILMRMLGPRLVHYGSPGEIL